MRTILIAHARRYPVWEINDLYKLLHQASMGNEHAAPEESKARQWLLDEIRRLGEGPAEPLVDPISPDLSVVRVHLRPFAQADTSVEELLAAFLNTARRFPASETRLEEYGRVAVQLAGEGLIPFSAAQLFGFLDQMQARGFPAVHHSPPYTAVYRPAYRVVARQFLPPGIEI